MVKYQIRLDVSRPGSQALVSVKQGDVKTRQLVIRLTNQSYPYELPEGETVVLRAVKPDETVIFNECAVEGNIIRHTMSEQMLAVTGMVKCELNIYGEEGEILYSPFFEVYVEGTL